MLRSLVGSEMCIRDRGTVGGAGQWCGVPRGCGLRNIGQPRAHACPHAGSCLLYTSDAADDLLCVDLGGRRIIKKKNNHDTYFA